VGEWVGRSIGKYQIVATLGHGGMAEVVKGYHPGLNRHVAIKLMHPFLAQDPDFLARFQREAQSAAALRHPHIVQIHDFDIEENGTSYVVMEFIDGQPLSHLMDTHHQQQHRLPLDDSLRLVAEIGSALAYAHRQGMVHRDVKPANVMVHPATHLGRAILTDFGLVKMVSGTAHTAPDVVLGTPAYIAPETCLGDPSDGRTDLYSLGVILFELLTGQRPFEAENQMGLVWQHVNEPPPRPRGLNSEIPPWLEVVVLKSLAKQPVNRYQTVEHFLQALALAGQDDQTAQWANTKREGQAAATISITDPLPYNPESAAERARLAQAIAHLEAQRPILGDTIVEAALAPLREKLQALDKPVVVEERRQVTVLSAAFPALQQIADPEEASSLRQAYFQRCCWAIGRHGGVVEKFTGPTLMAVFGVPAARESDPEEAIRAALDLCQAVAMMPAMTPDLPPIQASLSTGQVVVSFPKGRAGQEIAVVANRSTWPSGC
jgi:serine/threonine protein kinase